jgi:hypothetical protein
MSAARVPRPDFAGLRDDQDEAYTLRMPTRQMPSDALEEAISAAILRFAKEKFEGRPLAEASLGRSTEDSNEEASDSASGRSRSRSKSRSRSAKPESGPESGAMDVDESNRAGERGNREDLKPMVSADDELSYDLLRPSVRHLLSKLDNVLTILHNSREATVSYVSDSSDSNASGSSGPNQRSTRSKSQSPVKRKRGRPRKVLTASVGNGSEPPTGTSDYEAGEATATPSAGKGKRGRPKKRHTRLEGESDRAYAVRIARLQKRPIPIFSDYPVSGAGQEPAVAEEDVTATNPSNKRERIRSPGGSPIRSQNRKADTAYPWKKSYALRGWRDVLRAASLAGLPAPAIDRAARRCADLFGQSTVLHTLPEGPRTQISTTVYEPGMAMPPLFPSDEGEPQPTQMRPQPPSEEEGRGRSRSNISRSRSRSASAGGIYHCEWPACPRATEGFSRKANLVRHLKLVHGFEGDDLPIEVDS